MNPEQINAMDQRAFVKAFGGVFEHSPWVAERAWVRRPFVDVETLCAAMCAVVAAATPAEQLTLIRAHPQLAGRAAVRGELTDASSREQRGAGLDQCSPAEFAQLTGLNAAYETRFGFPFIVAVRGHTRDSIIADMQRRLAHSIEQEHAEALRQVGRIASFRLADMMA